MTTEAGLQVDSTKETDPVQKILLHMEEMNAQQLKIMKKQLNFSRISALILAILVLCIFIFGITITPRINKVLDDVAVISSELASEDWSQLFIDVSSVIEGTQQSVQNFSSQIQNIQFESLNKAIIDLQSILEGLSNFLGL